VVREKRIMAGEYLHGRTTFLHINLKLATKPAIANNCCWQHLALICIFKIRCFPVVLHLLFFPLEFNVPLPEPSAESRIKKLIICSFADRNRTARTVVDSSTMLMFIPSALLAIAPCVIGICLHVFTHLLFNLF